MNLLVSRVASGPFTSARPDRKPHILPGLATARSTKTENASPAANSPTNAKDQTAKGALDLTPLTRRDLLLGSSLITLSLTLPTEPSHAANIDMVFVAGSTGNTGRRVVQQLRAAGYKVKAGVRDPKKAQSLGFGLDSGIELVTADVTKGSEPLISALSGSQAVICATGYSGFNPGGSVKIDEKGVANLVDAAKASGVTKFVLLSSLLTNARAVGQESNPNYKFLNLLGGVLDHKLAGEKYLRASGLDWTIVRPGGLSNDPPAEVGNLVVGKEDTLFGLPDDPGRAISRDTVAAVLVAALSQSSSSDKLVEIVAAKGAPELPKEQWFSV